MAKGRRKSLTKNQLKWNKLVTSIKRLGYESLIPEKSSRITKRELQKLELAQQEAKAGQKARQSAIRRVKYWQKKGYYIDTSILPARGAPAAEYESFTGEKIKQEAASKDWTDGERIQPYEDRYNSTIAILEQIDAEISSYIPAHPYHRNAMWWVRWKESIHSIIKTYWDDIYSDATNEEIVQLAARLESKASTLRDLIQKALYSSNSKDADNQNLSLIIETLTGAKLSAIESAYINDAQEGLEYE